MASRIIEFIDLPRDGSIVDLLLIKELPVKTDKVFSITISPLIVKARIKDGCFKVLKNEDLDFDPFEDGYTIKSYIKG